jgi:hypothetical protein
MRRRLGTATDQVRTADDRTIGFFGSKVPGVQISPLRLNFKSQNQYAARLGALWYGEYFPGIIPPLSTKK